MQLVLGIAGVYAGDSPLTHVEIYADNLIVDESHLDSGLVYVCASDESYRLRLVARIDFQADARYVTKDLVRDSSFVYDIALDTLYQIDVAAFAIGTPESGIRAVRGELVATNGVCYDLDLHAPDALVGDTRFEDFEAIFTPRDVMLYAQNQPNYGVVLVQAANWDGQVAALTFVGAAERDTVQVIRSGHYVVNQLMTENTIMASPGIIDNRIYSSYAGYIDEDNEVMRSPIWFITQGEAEVTMLGEFLHIDLQALNSHDRTVHIVMDIDPKNRVEGIDEVLETEGGVRKLLRNGQIVIECNDKQYNILGMKINQNQWLNYLKK